ncbi:MAG: c-type cytochrome [Byssovorax sp.]
MQRLLLAALVAAPLAAFACGEAASPSSSTTGAGGSTGTTSSTGTAGGSAGGGSPYLPGTPIPADPQREGNAEAGYSALVNNGYVSCGVPWSAYSKVFGSAPDSLKIPGRTGKNQDLPYYYTAFTTAEGVEVVSANCLVCHAGFIKGKLVLGLGGADRDFTTDASQQANAAGFLISDPKEKAAWAKWAERMTAIGPYTMTLTVGVNPADNLAAVLFAHRDRKTLAWSSEPLLELPPKQVVPVDTPPWWRMAKKNAMFYVAGGRGDHARIMMTASTLCTDSVAEAQAIDAYFPDVEAWIRSIAPPAFPGAIDQALAGKGKDVFGATCAKCHGTYGKDGSYPNLLIATGDVGTDPLLASGSTQFAEIYVKWFNESFYGEKAKLEPQDGYVAPPLDGIWATAPYLHNGSVPTIEALLDSKKRPAFWTRSFDSNDYDDTTLGWTFTALDAGQDAEPNKAKRAKIYDTTKPGYGNGGHLYGDDLSAGDRAAVIEYLKTL